MNYEEIDEIRSDFICEDGYVHLDVYFKDTEHGKNVCKIDTHNGVVAYIDPDYISCERLREEIFECVKNIEEEITLTKIEIVRILQKVPDKTTEIILREILFSACSIDGGQVKEIIKKYMPEKNIFPVRR